MAKRKKPPKLVDCRCGCRGYQADHDDRSWGQWACPECDEESDADYGKPCSECARRANPDEEIRRLERQALTGDEAAVHRLAGWARRSGEGQLNMPASIEGALEAALDNMDRLDPMTEEEREDIEGVVILLTEALLDIRDSREDGRIWASTEDYLDRPSPRNPGMHARWDALTEEQINKMGRQELLHYLLWNDRNGTWDQANSIEEYPSLTQLREDLWTMVQETKKV